MASAQTQTLYPSLRLVERSLPAGEQLVAAGDSTRLRTGDERKVTRENGTTFVTNKGLHFVGHRLLDVLPTVAHLRFDFQDITNWHLEPAEDRAMLTFDHDITGSESFLVSRGFANTVQEQLNASGG